jgi:hypothetical protein
MSSAQPLKALSICQPWAYLIVTGDKRIENRSWPTRHRGSLVIHAGLNRDAYHQAVEKYGLAALEQKWGLPKLGDEHFGVLCGLVTVVDCEPLEAALGQPYATGPWCWILENARQFPPIPFKGTLGLFTLPAAIAERIRRSAK